MLDQILDPMFLLAGVALLLAGGHWLVIGAVAIATRIGFSTLMIGLTIVAFGTSAPELAFNVIAAVSGSPDLSFGNVIGSNIANIGLVLAIGAFISPLVVHSQILRKELPWLLVVTLLMVALPFVPGANISNGDGETLRGFVRPHGAGMLVGFALLSWGWFRLGRRGQDDVLNAEVAETPAVHSGDSMRRASLIFVAGLLALLAGGRLAEHGAVQLAAGWGLSKSVIGLTIVAISTSLPELATTWAACRRGHTDLAVGNVVGSNLFNILLVLGVTSSIAPVPVPGLANLAAPFAAHGFQDLAFMTFMTLLLVAMAFTGQRRVSRREGFVLLGLFVLYMTWSIAREKLI